MRTCPICGGSQRRQVAPGFYECLAARGKLHTDDNTHQPTCGFRYMDTSHEQGQFRERLSALFG